MAHSFAKEGSILHDQVIPGSALTRHAMPDAILKYPKIFQLNEYRHQAKGNRERCPHAPTNTVRTDYSVATVALTEARVTFGEAENLAHASIRGGRIVDKNVELCKRKQTAASHL